MLLSLSLTGGQSILYVDDMLVADTATYNVALRDTSGAARGYKTLASALHGAQAGDSIVMRSGTYRAVEVFAASSECCFHINKSVSIAAYTGEAVTLTYPVGDPPLFDATNYGPIIYINANDVSLDGLTVVGTHAEGDNPNTDTDISVQLANNRGGVIVRNCAINGNGHAGIKWGTLNGSLLIEDNTITTTGFTNQDHGIYAPVGGAVIIQRNNISGASNSGLCIYDIPDGIEVYDNILNENAIGLTLNGSNHVIERNTMNNNSLYGLMTWHRCGDCLIRDNEMCGNPATRDVVITTHAGYQNTASDNRYDGISLGDGESILASWGDDGSNGPCL